MKCFRRNEFEGVWGDNATMIQQYRRVWDSSPVLRRFYATIWGWAYNEVTRHPVVELGGGAGFIRDRYPEVITTDLLAFPESNLQCNAIALPFKPNSIGAFLGVAFFHHCPAPKDLFREISTALQPGGRLILIDPYISVLSRWIYAIATDEAVHLGEDTLQQDYDTALNPLLDANVARATIVFKHKRAQFEAMFPELMIESVEYTNLFRHIAAGSCVQQFPAAPLFYPPAAMLDWLLSPIQRYTGMCLKVVLQKQG